MSGYLEPDEFGYDEPVDDPDLSPQEALEAAYWADPVGFHKDVIREAVAEVGAQIEAANAQRYAVMQDERMSTVQRQAAAALDEKYGDGWHQDVPAVADVLREDAIRGALPTDDALKLARHVERVYLAEREKARPSRDQENATYWQRVKDSDHTQYGY